MSSSAAGASGAAMIVGIGHYLPPRLVTNAELPASLEVEPAGVVKRTGIETRHYADAGVTTSDLAAEAARAAVKNAGYELGDMDCLIAATLSPDYGFPGLGVYTQAKLGLEGLPAYDVRDQCSGFLYSLNVARAFVQQGIHRRVLVLCAELHSHGMGKTPLHAHITPLFGDGAAAIVVATEPSPAGPRIRIDHLQVHADGRGADRLRQRVWDMSLDPFMDWRQVADSTEEMWYAEMDGEFIFRRAVKTMAKVGKEALETMGLGLDDVDWILPHQANRNINKTVCNVLGVPLAKMLSNIERVGNTTAASIPLLLSESLEEGKIESGQRILSLAFGSGLTWGAAILEVLSPGTNP